MIIGFHTCRNSGSLNFPFLSNDHAKTWLTQGYYFWTDSDTWGHFWGNNSVRGTDYAILKCKIKFKEDDYLDLVGNARHLELFAEFVNLIGIKSEKDDEITIRQIIQWCRFLEKTSSGAFPYLGIKAADFPEEHYHFVKNIKDKMVTLNRQQLCVFEDAKDKIKFVECNIYEKKDKKD